MSTTTLQEQEALTDTQLKAQLLGNSRPLNLQYKLDAKPIAGLLRKLYRQLALPSRGKCNRRNRTVLRYVVSDLVRSHQEDPLQYLGVSLNSNDYSSQNRYNSRRISYRKLRNILGLLFDAGYVERHEGYFDPVLGRGACTRIRATPELLSLLNEGIKHIALACSADEYEPIVLRDGKPTDPELRSEARGRLIQYEDTTEIIRMRKAMRDYVSGLHEHKLTNPADHSQWDEKPLMWRKFCNGSWECGGRIYGGKWQNCKKELRPHILIDGETTVERDYVALHGCLAYARKGIGWWEKVEERHPIAQDPYTAPWRPLTDEQWRRFFKKALNIALSAPNERVTVQALNRVWFEDQWSGAGKLPLDFQSKGLIAAEMRRFLGEQGPHAEIGDLFFRGIGLNLQYWDSQIAELIFQEFTACGKVVLGIHDSFIVKKSDQEMLEDVMTRAYQKRIGFMPKFK